jgi:metal-sulfur cluster biosynthetic enzyme
MVIYSIDAFSPMTQDVKQLRVKIFDELSKIVDPEINTTITELELLSKIVDPEINTTITELELIDEVDINNSNVKIDLHLTSPFCPAVFGFKICQDVHDNLLKIDGIDDVKVNVSNHFMAEQINNQVNNSPNPKKSSN